MMKKLMMAMVAVLMVFGMAVAPASAAAGWQNLGTQWYNHYNSLPQRSLTYVAHDGGNIGIQMDYRTKISDASNCNGYCDVTVMLYEKDPVGFNWIGGFSYQPSQYGTRTYTFDINRFRDGPDGKAEIYYTVSAEHVGTTVISFLD